jgi:tetratricopeptide (TPR) repeat protein
MSLWHQLWNTPDEATLKKGLAEVKAAESLPAKTGRERDYIAAAAKFYASPAKHNQRRRAAAYSKAMERVYKRNPEDREAAAFYALSLLASRPDDNNNADRKKAAAVLEKLFAIEPDHPGVAHYLIHSYDKPGMAELGLPAARRYAKIAPAAPHAVHMPSHIFARLGLWQDDIDSNLASIAATRNSAAMHMGGEGHQFHAMDFLVYAYLQSGREAEAQRVIDEVKAMPPMKDMYGEGTDPHIYFEVILPASYALELHHWNEAASLPLVKGTELGDDSITYRARAIGSARGGDAAAARKALSDLQNLYQLAKDKKVSFLDQIEKDSQQAEAWVDHAEGKDAEAVKLLRDLADQEDDGAYEAGEGIPAKEMLADLLLELKRPQEALREYEADLKLNPNRFNALYGAAQAAASLGDTAKAASYYAQLVKLCSGSPSTRPELVEAKAQVAKEDNKVSQAAQ